MLWLEHKIKGDSYEENVYKPCINSNGVVSCYMNVPHLLEMLST